MTGIPETPRPADPGPAGRLPLLLIVNTHSRRGAGAAEGVALALDQAGLAVITRSCSEAHELPNLIRNLADQVSGVVIGGGDGTLNAAAPGLIDTGLPLGIIPLGTANDLARTLGLPLDPVQAAGIVAMGKIRRIDLGDVNGHPFFNVASLGFGVDLTRALTRDAKRRWGVLGYATAALRVLSRLQPFSAEIIEGGTSRRSRTVHIAVGNGRHYGGGMTIDEHAQIDDGQLDLYSLEVRNFWNLLLLLPALRKGRHRTRPDMLTLSGREIEIRTRRRRSVNTDGEITTHTPARFRVLPKAISIYVP